MEQRARKCMYSYLTGTLPVKLSGYVQDRVCSLQLRFLGPEQPPLTVPPGPASHNSKSHYPRTPHLTKALAWVRTIWSCRGKVYCKISKGTKVSLKISKPMAIKLSHSQVNSWRLSKHHLDKRASKADMARVVSDLCGVQAQVLSGAALSIWARVENITIHDVEDALWEQRILVKTWGMRGTLHLLSSTDLPIYIAALKTRLERFREKITYRIGPGPEDKEYHITSEEQEQVTRAIHNALDGHNLTREELAREVVEHARLRRTLQKHLLSGFGSLLQPAAFQGSLIFGPSQGPKVTFTRPDQWLGKLSLPPSEKAFKT